MTRAEILAMQPGRELNIKVAEVIIGHEVLWDETFGDMERYIDNDGRSDMIFHFRTQQTGIEDGDESAMLSGRSFFGTDSIRAFYNKKNKKK